MKKRKLYVACALTHAPKEFVEGIKRLKAKLSENFEVLDFLGTEGTKPKEIYHWDIGGCVYKSEAVVAICDYPSLGLGYEMATMLEKREMLVMAFAHWDSLVSKLIIGIDKPPYSFCRYGTHEDMSTLNDSNIEKIVADVEYVMLPAEVKCENCCNSVEKDRTECDGCSNYCNWSPLNTLAINN
jgi:hypothetical protein